MTYIPIVTEIDDEIRIGFTEGEVINVGGRDIGIHKMGHLWRATDVKTGMCFSDPDGDPNYKTKEELIEITKASSGKIQLMSESGMFREKEDMLFSVLIDIAKKAVRGENLDDISNVTEYYMEESVEAES